MSGSPTQSLCHDGGATVAKSNLKDRISALPDDILCFILSSLTTKEAAATSVLSKRWKPLWRSVPTLNITYYKSSEGVSISKEEDCYARFVEGVNSVILHNFHNSIRKFHLRCSSPFTDPADVVNAWVNAAAQRGLHHIDFNISLSMSLRPLNLSSIFTCKTLVVLKLKGFFTPEPISFVNLPSLKLLFLQYVRFSVRACLANLLSGCPLLEDFRESTSLTIKRDSKWIDKCVTGTPFKTLPKLLKANISTLQARNILGVVNNVKFMNIERMELGLVISGTDPYVFPMFHNLTHIQLEYLFCYCKDNWSKVVEFLKHYCPKLQVLVIYQKNGEDECPPSILHLKRCSEEKFRSGTYTRYIMEDSKEDDDKMHWRWQNSTWKA